MSEFKPLPCPFCGGEAELLSDSSSTVQCRNDQCIIGSEAPFNDFSHQWDAIAAWNRRAHTDAQAARIAKLEGERREIIAALEVASQIAGSNRCQVFVRAYVSEEPWAVADVAKHLAALEPRA